MAVASTAYEAVRYEVPAGSREWLHVLYGHVPGYQQDYIYQPILSESGLRPQHLGPLSEHFKSLEPATPDGFAFALVNLKPMAAARTSSALAMLITVRVQGARAPQGRVRPVFAHAIVAVDRDLSPELLDQAYRVFKTALVGQRASERPIDKWYAGYEQQPRELLKKTAEHRRFLAKYIQRFDALPILPVAPAEESIQARPGPDFSTLYIDYPASTQTAALGRWSAELASLLSHTTVRWSSVQFGTQPQTLGFPTVHSGLTVHFLPEGAQRPHGAGHKSISHAQFLAYQSQNQFGVLFGLELSLEPPASWPSPSAHFSDDGGPRSAVDGEESVPGGPDDSLDSHNPDGSNLRSQPSAGLKSLTEESATSPDETSREAPRPQLAFEQPDFIRAPPTGVQPIAPLTKGAANPVPDLNPTHQGLRNHEMVPKNSFWRGLCLGMLLGGSLGFVLCWLLISENVTKPNKQKRQDSALPHSASFPLSLPLYLGRSSESVVSTADLAIDDGGQTLATADSQGEHKTLNKNNENQPDPVLALHPSNTKSHDQLNKRTHTIDKVGSKAVSLTKSNEEFSTPHAAKPKGGDSAKSEVERTSSLQESSPASTVSNSVGQMPKSEPLRSAAKPVVPAMPSSRSEEDVRNSTKDTEPATGREQPQ